MSDIQGAKGGGSSSPRPATEAPDSLHSVARARILDLVSEGEILGFAHGATNPLQDIYLNETPVANADGTLNFTDVQVDSRVGSQSQTYMSGFSGVENEIAVGLELRASTPWSQSLTDTTLSAVRVRLSVPSLQKSNTSTGDITGYNIKYKIELSTDGGSFQTVIDSGFTGKTTSKYERTHRINLPAADTGWVIRITRTTANADSATIADTTTVESYTAIVDDKFRYPNSAMVGIIIDAQQFSSIPTRAYDLYGRIVQVPANYNPTTRVYATSGTGTSGGAWNGTFKPAWTDNPAWVFYDLATNPRYGLGQYVSAALLNKWALYQIAQYCDGMVSDGSGGLEPRFTCNLFLQTQADAYKVLQDLSSVFRGMVYWAGGAIQAVADMPQDPVYTYTQANVIDGKFTYQGSGRKTRYTTALVSWNDPKDFGRAKVEYVPDNEGISRYGIQQTSITGFGCTSQSQAHRIGLWTLLTSRLETETVSFSVGLDGTIAAPGQIIRVADSLRGGRRFGGRIVVADTNMILLDDGVHVAAGASITINMPDGTSQTRTIQTVESPITWDSTGITFDSTLYTFDMATVGGTGENIRRIYVTVPFSEAPQPESVWVVENLDVAAQTYRVVSVLEDGQGPQLSFTINALKHDPSKFAAVDSGAPLSDHPNVRVTASTQPAPASCSLSGSAVITQGVAGNLLTASWPATAGAIRFIMQWKKDDGQWSAQQSVYSLSADVSGLHEGVYVARVIAVNQSGIQSTPTESPPFTIADVGHRTSQKYSSMLTVGGVRSTWSGAAITYSATPTSATISVASGTLKDGVSNPAYAASSATVSGTAGTTVGYWLYYDDPTASGGSFALGATTDYTDLSENQGRIWVGQVSVVFPTSGSGSGGGSGGGGGPCVSVESFVLERTRGWIVAGNVRVGDELRLLNPGTLAVRWGRVSYSSPKLASRVRFHAGGECLTCSTSAPIGVWEGGAVIAPDLMGHRVPLIIQSDSSDRCIVTDVSSVEHIADGLVQHITCENDFFLASDRAGAGFAHHNLKQVPDL